MSSNIQQKRQDQLQMSQKTNMTNKVMNTKGGIDYESAYGSRKQSREKLSPMTKENQTNDSEYTEARFAQTSNNKETKLQ